MHCQCLLANDLIQYGYGNASVGMHRVQILFAKSVFRSDPANAICSHRQARDDTRPPQLVISSLRG
jgi:hypothetical protein